MRDVAAQASLRCALWLLLSVQSNDVVLVTRLVVGRMQPSRAGDAQLSTVKSAGAGAAAVGARTQRAQQRGVRPAAEHARRRRRRRWRRRGDRAATVAAGVKRCMAANAEVDAARDGARRAVNDRRRIAAQPETAATHAAATRRRRLAVLHRAESCNWNIYLRFPK